MGGLKLNIKFRDSNVLARLEETTTVILPREMENMVEEIVKASIATAQVYPPETEGNQPPPPYYRRGAGMIGLSGGVVRGKESENLRAQWIYDISSTDFSTEALVQNLASYSGYVHGDVQDRPPQTIFHRAHGWKTIVNIVKAEAGDTEGALAVVQGAVEKLAQNIVDFFNR